MTAPGPVRTRPAAPLDSSEAHYRGLRPGTEVLTAGTRVQRGALRLPCDVVRERDVALVLRDGTTLRADVYRPRTDVPVPAILNWAPYGKGGTGFWTLDNSAMFPNRFGIPRGRVSGLQSWEGNDPAYWCAHGYAVVQVDARGVFDSEGDVHYLASAEGRDAHDAVEGVAALGWCSGKVGMAGNSWLAMTQWRAASERPEHLAAIAPWEGLTDLYRDTLARGGVPSPEFPDFIGQKIFGRGRVEDPVAMLEEHPLVDDYWADKVPDVARIDVPAYVVASYSNRLHVGGTFRAWARLRGPKWLRVHNTHEWVDFYEPERVEDLRRFFDRYLLGADNGWEDTPAVRFAVLDPGGSDVVDRPAATFPPPGTAATELFLHARDRGLQAAPPQEETTASYALADADPHVDFTHRFTATTEVVGAPVLTVWVCAWGAEDADLFVAVQKLDRRGREQWHQTVTLGLPLARRWMPVLQRRGVSAVGAAFHSGPTGILRVSRRGLDADAPADLPELSLREESPLVQGEPVEVTVPLWPTAMRWRAGEQLRLRVAGRTEVPPELPGLPERATQPGDVHLFHTGGRFRSRLVLPVAPGAPAAPEAAGGGRR